MQLTDLHLNENPTKNLLTWNNLRGAVVAEQPDLIMLTGDLVYGNPPMEVFCAMLDSLDVYSIPYALVFGNHDAQFGVSNAALLAEARKRPLCVASDVPGITGDGNYQLKIYGSAGSAVSGGSRKAGANGSGKGRSNVPEAILWCFDSGEESPMSRSISPTYDYSYIHSDQIEWYGKLSALSTQKNGGTPIPALAFMHIPLPEYAEAASKAIAASEAAPTGTTEAATTRLCGTRGEGECASRFNSGLFCKMLEMKDIMGVFCGHDHDNDYSTTHYGILLAYGRHSGSKNEYYNLGLNGCRLINLRQGSRSFTTWVRLSDGSIINQDNYPSK